MITFSVGSFRTFIKTGSLLSAGTNGKVHLTIYGEDGNSGNNVLGSGESFQSGRTDEFLVRKWLRNWLLFSYCKRR